MKIASTCCDCMPWVFKIATSACFSITTMISAEIILNAATPTISPSISPIMFFSIRTA
ncbi:Uncharacterised protein [Vibrio cholerae]|nr:Uncharacterised protein [Vibrio cholerae]